MAGLMGCRVAVPKSANCAGDKGEKDMLEMAVGNGR